MTKQNNLTWRERKAIMDYKIAHSYIINDALRREIELDEFYKELVSILDEALERVPMCKENMIVRCIDFDIKEELDAFLDIHKTGNIVEYKAYSSFSTDYKKLYNKTANIKLVVYNPKKPRDLRNIGKNKEEEVLYERNSKFKILSNNAWGNAYWIELEEL